MKDFKMCKYGHRYSTVHEKCPVCENEKKVRSDDNNMKRTKIYHGTIGDKKKTKILPPKENLKKTKRIHQDTAHEEVQKLCGWLVSFTLSEKGIDFRLYEGRNTIGKNPDCDICIDSDPKISSTHLTILFRHGQIKFKDELSTNGSFVNGKFMEEGDLYDGDIIKIGDTELKIRTV